VHEKISVNTFVVRDLSLSSLINGLSSHGLTCATIPYTQLIGQQDSFSLLKDSDITVRSVVVPNSCNLRDSLSRETAYQALQKGIELALEVDAPFVYTTSGSAQGLEWGPALDMSVEVLGPAADLARKLGVTLLVENSSAMRADFGFCHTLHDTAELARNAGCGICADIGTCWTERDLRQVITNEIESIDLVQLCDYRYGITDAQCKETLGTGDMPLENFLDYFVEAGYTGCFDIELNGPHVRENDSFASMAQSVQWLEIQLAGRCL